MHFQAVVEVVFVSGGLVNYVPQTMSMETGYELGVTNSWSYSETGAGEQKASDSESERLTVIRPDATGDAFSKAETSSADLLF